MARTNKEEFIKEYVLNRSKTVTDSFDGEAAAKAAAAIYDAHLAEPVKRKTESVEPNKPQLLNE